MKEPDFKPVQSPPEIKNRTADTSDKTHLSTPAFQNQLPPKDALIGTVFMDAYTIERSIGSGGMGAVYLVREISSNQELALKLLHPQALYDAQVLRNDFAWKGRLLLGFITKM